MEESTRLWHTLRQQGQRKQKQHSSKVPKDNNELLELAINFIHNKNNQMQIRLNSRGVQTVGSVKFRLKTANPFKIAVDTSSAILVRLVLQSRRVTIFLGDGLLGWFVSVIMVREEEERAYFTVVILL